MEFKFLVDRQDAIPLVASWYYEEWGKEVPESSVQQTIERIKGKLNRDKPPLHILAVEDEEVLGVAQLKRHEMSIYPDKEFWLGSLFVSPQFRGRGIASALADRTAATAKSFGVKELHLQTECLDGGLYRRLGWHSIETVVYGDVHVAVMIRQLG